MKKILKEPLLHFVLVGAALFGAYDAKRYGVTPLPGTAMIVAERAYTSPIWYTPAK